MTMAAQEKRKEYCDILGVDEGASKEEIKKAYKKLAIRCHPDKNQLNPEATKEFQRISEAYTGLCQGDDYREDEDDFDGGGFSVFELLQMFFMRYQRNFWNCSTQPTWNEDWQMPGSTISSSSSAGRGNSGRNKGKKRNNRKNATSSHKSSAKASSPSNSGSSTMSGSANEYPEAMDCTDAGTDEADFVKENTSSDQLISESAIGNQTNAERAVADKSKVETGDCTASACGSKTNDETKNADNFTERRGSNSSTNGSSQNSSDKKPNRKKLQAEQRKREKECAEIRKEVLEKNRKEEEKRKKKEEKEKAKLAAASDNLTFRTESEMEKTDLLVTGEGELYGGDQEDNCVETDIHCEQKEQQSELQSLEATDRIADGSECNQELIETSNIEGMNDGGKDSSEVLKNIGLERELYYKGSYGRPFQNDRPMFSRVFYSSSGYHGPNRSAVKNSEHFSMKTAADKFKIENTHFRSEPDGFSFGDHCSNSGLQDKKDVGSCANSCSLSGVNQSGGQCNSHCYTDNVFKTRGRHSSGSFGRRGQMHPSQASDVQLEDDFNSELKISTSRNSECTDENSSSSRRQNYQYQKYAAHSFEGQHCRGSRGGRRNGGFRPRYRNYEQNGSGGFDGGGSGGQRHLDISAPDAFPEKRSDCAENEAGDCVNLANERGHLGTAKHGPLDDQRDYSPFRNGGRGRGWNRGYGRGGMRPGDAYKKNIDRKQCVQEFGKKHCGTSNKNASFSHGGGGDAFNGKTMQFYRSKTTSEDRNLGELNQHASSQFQKQLNSKESETESKGREPGHSAFATELPDVPVKNIWKDRQEFYEGALPKSKEEEEEMLKAALKLSQLDVEGELTTQLSSEIDSKICLSSEQIDRGSNEIMNKRWADEMEDDDILSDAHVTSASFSKHGGHSAQSATCAAAESVQYCDRFNGVLHRKAAVEIPQLSIAVPVDAKHGEFVPDTAVVSATVNATQKAVDSINADDFNPSTNLKHDVLESDEGVKIRNTCVSEILGTLPAPALPPADEDTLKTVDGTLDIHSVQTEESTTTSSRQLSMLDDVDDYCQDDIVLDQPVSESNDNFVDEGQLPVGDNNCLATNEFFCDDALENKGIGVNNDPVDPYSNYAFPAGYMPHMLPNGYSPYIHPYSPYIHPYPCPQYFPYVVPGVPMMPSTSQPPSCMTHPQNAEHCVGEVQLPVATGLPVADLREQSHLAQPPFIPPVFHPFPFGFNSHGTNVAAYGFHMPPYLHLNIPFQHYHPTAHDEINNSSLDSELAKAPADEDAK